MGSQAFRKSYIFLNNSLFPIELTISQLFSPPASDILTTFSRITKLTHLHLTESTNAVFPLMQWMSCFYLRADPYFFPGSLPSRLRMGFASLSLLYHWFAPLAVTHYILDVFSC